MWRETTLYFDMFLTGKVCLCAQEKKERSVQCLVLFCKTPSPLFLLLDTVCSSQVHQAFQAWVLWVDETLFNLFLSQQLRTESAQWPSLSLSRHLLRLAASFSDSVLSFSREKSYFRLSFIPFPHKKTDGVRMPNICIWNLFNQETSVFNRNFTH